MSTNPPNLTNGHQPDTINSFRGFEFTQNEISPEQIIAPDTLPTLTLQSNHQRLILQADPEGPLFQFNLSSAPYTIEGPLSNGPIQRVDRRDGEEEEGYIYHSNGTNGYHANHGNGTNGYHDNSTTTNGYHSNRATGYHTNGNNNSTSGYHSNSIHDNDTSSSNNSTDEHNFGNIPRLIFINGNDEAPNHNMPDGHRRRRAINGTHPSNGYGNHNGHHHSNNHGNHHGNNHGNHHGNHGNNDDTDSGYLGGESVVDELVFEVESVLENGHVMSDDNIEDVSPDNTMEFLDELP